MGQKWGQHFLRSQATVDKIIAAAGILPDSLVLEIGPGEGVLTLKLCALAQRVHAFEIDPVLAEALQSRALPNLILHQGDFLKQDPALCLGEDSDKELIAVANLPYYITAPIVERLLWQQPLKIASAVVMVQEEVAQRICGPATRAAGALSYIAGAYFACEYLFKVLPNCFSPPPNVDSAVIRLTRREQKPEPNSGLKKTYERLVNVSFQGRRKQLGKSLRALRPDAQDILAQAHIDYTRRPETLTVQEFWSLARIWPHCE